MIIFILQKKQNPWHTQKLSHSNCFERISPLEGKQRKTKIKDKRLIWRVPLWEYKSAFLHLFWGLTAKNYRFEMIIYNDEFFWHKIILTFVYVLSFDFDFGHGSRDDWQFHSFSSLRSNLKTEIEVLFSPFFFFLSLKEHL